MTPDPEQRLPRELLKELIEEGSDAFRGVLEKLLNTAMQMEREEFLFRPPGLGCRVTQTDLKEK